MSNQNLQPHSHSRFWTGFTVGAVLGVTSIYFFGTKQGRKNLKRAMELTENLEETIEKTIGGVGEDYLDGLSGSDSSLRQAKGNTGIDREAEQGSIVGEKESLFSLILKAVASYLHKSQIKTASTEPKSDKVVH